MLGKYLLASYILHQQSRHCNLNYSMIHIPSTTTVGQQNVSGKREIERPIHVGCDISLLRLQHFDLP